MSIAMGTRLHINLYIYIKLQVCRFWCFYHKIHNPSKKLSLSAGLTLGGVVVDANGTRRLVDAV